MKHKQISIAKRYLTLEGYSKPENGGNYLEIVASGNKDAFISNIRPKGDAVTIISSGSPQTIPNFVLDKYLVSSDSSYNPSRPFRWYRSIIKHNTICVMTTTEEEIDKGRKESFKELLAELEFPEMIWIYELD